MTQFMRQVATKIWWSSLGLHRQTSADGNRKKKKSVKDFFSCTTSIQWKKITDVGQRRCRDNRRKTRGLIHKRMTSSLKYLTKRKKRSEGNELRRLVCAGRRQRKRNEEFEKPR